MLLSEGAVQGEVVSEEGAVVLALAVDDDSTGGQHRRAEGIAHQVTGGVIVDAIAGIEGGLGVGVVVMESALLVLELGVELQSVDDVELKSELYASLRVGDAVVA